MRQSAGREGVDGPIAADVACEFEVAAHIAADGMNAKERRLLAAHNAAHILLMNVRYGQS